MILYHISKCSYKVGDQIPESKITENYFMNKAKINNLVWVDDQLNKSVPTGQEINRNNCIYLFSKKTHCLRFAQGEDSDFIKNGWKLYTVEVNYFVKGIMPIVDLMKNYEADQSTLDKLSNEYWNTSKSYEFCEYLADNGIIRSVEDPIITSEIEIEMFALTIKWGEDKKIAKGILN